MATQKYIGARYMPKFVGTYDATSAYEALSVVDNGSGTTYVANKPVPVGTPLSDTDYWSVYGASSGAILDLQNRMQGAENDIDTLETNMGTAQGNITALQGAVSSMQSDVSLLKNRKIILISDSYGESPTSATSWMVYFKQYCGLTEGTDVFSAYISGSCFGLDAYSFTRVLQTLENVIDDKDEITDILVAGGINDRSYSESDILNGVNTFVTYARANYPNAKIHLAGIGCTRLNGEMYKYYNVAIQAYKNACGVVPIDYVEDSEYIFNDYSLLNTGDWLHPLAAASMMIGLGLANWFKNGTVLIKKAQCTTTFNKTSVYTGNNWTAIEINNGRNVSALIIPAWLTFPTAIQGGDTKIADISPAHFIWGEGTYCSFNIPCTITSGGNTIYNNMEFYISNGGLYIVNPYPNVTFVAPSRAFVTYPKFVC